MEAEIDDELEKDGLSDEFCTAEKGLKWLKKIERYRFSKRFKKEYNNMPKVIQKAFDKKISL
jgi:hypothetical protein